ncbi:ubiquinol-cytochrome c reductase iron-sulfur subunit [Dokdonella fugitiva]|jgi:ubiquinol-cytochrome c reductase iron-sulfur subunit|uniref:Ubiquinol-cytochrome c reductase iron-sulfur subunit n=1 Tax=Dokdonella fugitiva TaxID=328517 RepID=A0A4R2IC09_9GAMM|nr:ubiquinol-cytochrome c reductase iron-sulfur subunit [Dokdonella fugitiva]MBA8884964.1 ubiquinol-cytochrome c reductase iron-sulfur subunit [Dokdonella fugitiva]TCO42063.1 ubiquinol-cytochrome c reductase iron-sulfur subunit [Dokdonella fugitiva]
MANDAVVDKGRRRFLTATTSVVGGAGVALAAIPFVKSWEPSERAKSAGAPVLADIGKIEAGQKVTFEWRGLPVFVVNRTKAQLDTLASVDARLRDPKSDNTAQQPDYAKNEYRSIKPEWLVVTGICTHLGCVPDFFPELKPEPFDPQWKGGFYCPCHKSRYDMAGRVYDGVPAPANLAVPKYHFVDDTHILIGVDPDKGAA